MMARQTRSRRAPLLKSVLGRIRGSATPATQSGALPWRRDSSGEIKLMLITSKGGLRWIVPKGWPMPGKTLAESARQEALEEAGIEGKIEPRPIGRFTTDKILASGSTLRLSVEVYPLEVRSELNEWPESGERLRAWFSIEDAAAAAGPESLKDLIRAFGAR